MALGGTAYFQLEKSVTIVVDGRAVPLRTFDGTVGEVLEGAGIHLGAHDKVTPLPTAPVADGMEVQVLLGKQITLVLDGTQRVIWVTGDRTVAQVLDLINLRAGRGAYVRPSRGATVEDGDRIVFREAISVRLTVEGETRDIITNAVSVASLLDSLGVVTGPRDRVTPSTDARLVDGMDIRVVRVNIRRAAVTEPIPFDVEVRFDGSMLQGQERIQRQGSAGLRRIVYRVRTEDGKVVSRTVLSSEVVREPVSQIVVRGTRPPNSQYGEATWYHRDGMVAAHKTLPFGTEVTVTNLANGRRVTVIINDRGPYGDGRIIDLSDDAFAQLASLGAGVIDVRITW
jgi:resuscitation-promoting factor RpfB